MGTESFSGAGDIDLGDPDAAAVESGAEALQELVGEGEIHVRSHRGITARDEHEPALDQRVPRQGQPCRRAAREQSRRDAVQLLLIVGGEQSHGVRRKEQSAKTIENEKVAGMTIELLAHLLTGTDRRQSFRLLLVGQPLAGELRVPNRRQHVVGEGGRLLEDVLIRLGTACDVERDREGDERRRNDDEVADR